MGYFDDDEKRWFQLPSPFSTTPWLEFGPSVFRHAARDSWDFGLGELRSAAATVNPVDWWRGGVGAYRTYQQGGLGAVGSALLDGLNPFNKTDFYAAGQSFMNATLTAAPLLGLVPATKVPLVGPWLDARMGEIPFSYDAGLLLTGNEGVTDAITGQIRVRPATAFEPLDGLWSTVAHEQVHAYGVRSRPLWLRVPYHDLCEKLPLALFLEEYNAEARAVGVQAGLSFPFDHGYMSRGSVFSAAGGFLGARSLATWRLSGDSARSRRGRLPWF